jgi:hypothetical protein
MDTDGRLRHALDMTIILISVLAFAAGMFLRSRWALVLPLAIGSCAAIAAAASGHGLGDTPIPFLVVVCTVVMVGGQCTRRRVGSAIS